MRILFIDDEPVRAVGLLDHGADVTCVEKPDFVDLALRYKKFDLVCLDHDMPACDGYTIANDFLIARSIPVVAHSTNLAGARRIRQLLDDYDVPNAYYSILQSDFVRRCYIFCTFHHAQLKVRSTE